jgi:hypothetical protein
MAGKPEDNSPRGNAARESIAKQQRESRRRNRGNGDVADWGTVQPDLVVSVIERLTGEGAAIQFGYTRDGGSFVIRIVGDGEPFNEYVRPTEDINLYLAALLEDYPKGWSSS